MSKMPGGMVQFCKEDVLYSTSVQYRNGLLGTRDADEDNPGLSQDGDILRISQDTEIWRG